MNKPKPKAEPIVIAVSRIITPMPDSLVARIDKEWHKRELPSRSAMIRQLLLEALAK